jgi:hypothetical protein
VSGGHDHQQIKHVFEDQHHDQACSLQVHCPWPSRRIARREHTSCV